MRKTYDLSALRKKAVKIRKDILTMLSEAGSGHTGGSLSAVEILVHIVKRARLPRALRYFGR